MFLEKWYNVIRIVWGFFSLILKVITIGWEIRIITGLKIGNKSLSLYDLNRAIIAAVLIVLLDVLITIVVKRIVTNTVRTYRLNQTRLITSRI
jgi:hypothetical protein